MNQFSVKFVYKPNMSQIKYLFNLAYVQELSCMFMNDAFNNG